MKILLDTHTWVWGLEDPKRIGRKAAKLLERPSTGIYLSPASVWEAYHLFRKKKFRLTGTYSEWIEQALQRSPVLEAPFTLKVARRAVELRLPQPDLGDQFLLATAAVYGLTLLTTDAQLLDQSWAQTMDASR